MTRRQPAPLAKRLDAIDRELGLPLTADEDPQLQAAVAELRALVREGSR